MNTCARCGKRKPIDEFRKEGSATSGRSSICSRCVANDEQRRYHQNGGREKQKERKRALTAERNAKIEQLKDVPCADCGGRFPRVCMDFDHVRGIKIAAISRLVHAAGSWEIIAAEIAKCEVVCANCHRIRTLARGQYGARAEVMI
jgi:hypothetical protein